MGYTLTSLIHILILLTIFQSALTCATNSDSENYVWKWWISSGWWKKYSSGSDVHFNAGDHITCNIPDQSYVVFTPKHHLLATSSTTVAHAWGFVDTAVVREEDWTSGPSGLRNFFRNQICWVQPKYYADGKSDAIERARNDVERFQGQAVHYNVLTCNCEHWVRNWMYGSSYSKQSNFVGTVTFDVLTTDYKAYAGIHTCQKLFLFRSQSSILLSRTREMSEEILDAAKKEVQLNESLDFDSLQLRSAEQEMCFETDYRVLVKINPYLMSFQVERGVQPAENDEHAENQIS